MLAKPWILAWNALQRWSNSMWLIGSYQWFPIILSPLPLSSLLFPVLGSQEDQVTIEKHASVTMGLSPWMMITHADMCKHAHTLTHMLHQLWKGWGTVKTLVLIQIKVDATCFNSVSFKTCRTFKAKTTCAPAAKKKTCFFSHLCQHSAPLSLSLAVNQKGVLGVRGFQPGLERMQHSPAALYLVCFAVVTLFGLFLNDLVPNICTSTTGSNVCHTVWIKSRHDPNGKAGRGRQSCCSCKYTDDLELDLTYFAITSPSHPWMTYNNSLSGKALPWVTSKTGY